MIVLIGPLLFFAPGWVLVRRLAPGLPVPGQIGVAIVASVYVSAHVVNAIASVAGFGLSTILIATGLLGIGTVGLAAIPSRHLAPLTRPTLMGIRSTLRQDRAAWLVAATMCLVVFVVLAANGWRETPDGWVSGGWNWSDLLVHVAIGSSIASGNFPPDVPYFAGEPLAYHWFADFHGAITATAAGAEIIPIYFITSSLFAGVLALVVWALAIQLTGDRRVALIATILVSVGGGLGWIRLIGDVAAGAGGILDLISHNPYDNTWADGWPYFRIASVFGTGSLPHRATSLGLPGLVSIVLLVVTCLGRRPSGILLAGILAALLAPFQFFAFPATYLIAFLYAMTTRGWRARTVARDAVLFVGPVVFALPFIVDAVARQGSIGAFRIVMGWSEARVVDGPAAIAFFYLTNLGIPFVFAVIAGLTAHRLPGRWFLVSWSLAMFLLPNLVVVSSVEFDMNKYFQIMWIPVATLAAWLMRRWPRSIVAAVLVVTAISPALVAVWHVRSNVVALTLPQERAARWIASETPGDAIFITDAFINSPVDLAGRRRISTFGPYVANLGYDPAPRERDTRSVYCDGPEIAALRMADYGATFVLSSGGNPCDGSPSTAFGSSPLFETVYDDDGVSVWRLRDR